MVNQDPQPDIFETTMAPSLSGASPVGTSVTNTIFHTPRT